MIEALTKIIFVEYIIIKIKSKEKPTKWSVDYTPPVVPTNTTIAINAKITKAIGETEETTIHTILSFLVFEKTDDNMFTVSKIGTTKIKLTTAHI